MVYSTQRAIALSIGHEGNQNIVNGSPPPSPKANWEEARSIYKAERRTEIRNILGMKGINSLSQHIGKRTDWKLIINSEERAYEIEKKSYESLTEVQRSELNNRILKAAQQGFQYRYEAIRTPDKGGQEADPLASFVRFLSSSEVIAEIRRFPGCEDVIFADGQATSYGPGHFLTRHDDGIEGKHRRAAYVLSLTPNWRAEWGGLLMFHSPDGKVEETFVPDFGAFRLFAVPQMHSVSYVAPFAPHPRLSITGWFRAEG